MIAIVTAFSKKNNSHHFSLLPYRSKQDCIKNQPVVLYSLSSLYRPFYQNVLSSLSKKHPNLIYSEELAPPKMPDFFPRIKDVLSLLYDNAPQKIAVFCQAEENRLFPLLQAISPYSQRVSLITENPALSDKISEKALSELGLTVTQRSIFNLQAPHLILFLSGSFDLSSLKEGMLVNLSAQEVCSAIPTLSAISNQTIDGFFKKHPEIQLNPTVLLTKDMPVTRLIWKYR